jgi:hypothetical protein
MPVPQPVIATTYGVLAKVLTDLCYSNAAVKTVRIGPLSSVEMPYSDDPITKNSYKYPYIHFVPQLATMNGRSTEFEFEMIVMDLAKDNLNLDITVHSETLEITRDILSKFVLTDWNQFRYNVKLPSTAVPFVENFQNSVAGWTTRFVVEAMTPLNLCDAPFITPNDFSPGN